MLLIYIPAAFLTGVLVGVLKNCINAVRVGGRVGIIHYIWPSPPKNAVSVAAIGVLCGFNNRIRIYSVFERIE